MVSQRRFAWGGEEIVIMRGRGKSLRILVAGQVPPPYGGQNVMVERALGILPRPGWEVIHWQFSFTEEWSRARRAGLGKLLALARAWWSCFRIRFAGRIECILFPIGGPQLVPVIRDILLLPVALLCTRNTVLYFHAAGIETTMAHFPSPLRGAARAVYRRCKHAIVLTEYGRRDAVALGISNISVVPNGVPDSFDPIMIENRDFEREIRILSVGHLCEDKGTLVLLKAFRLLVERYSIELPKLRLVLVGEAMPPMTLQRVENMVLELGLEESIVIEGLLTGDQKWEAYARANLFVFPSSAPFESFGLVMVEAMMWSLPVIALDWRASSEVLGGVNALSLYKQSNSPVEALAAALEKAIAVRTSWSSWGERNRQHFLQAYSMAEMERKLVDCIYEVIEGK